MKCPHCHSEVRPSKKYPGYYLCDHCRKRYPAASVLPDKEYVRDEPSAKRGGQPRMSRRKAKKGRKPLYLFLAVLFLLILLGAAAYFSGLFDAAIHFLGISDQNNETSADASTPKASDVLYKPDETADIENVRVKVTGYEESLGDERAIPSEGYEFVFVNFEIVNNTEEEITVSSMASFESYCGGYRLDYSPEAFTALATTLDRQQIDGSIAGGGTLNGYLCLEVPADWQVIEIHYSTDVWSADKVKFVIEKAVS